MERARLANFGDGVYPTSNRRGHLQVMLLEARATLGRHRCDDALIIPMPFATRLREDTGLPD